MPLREEGCGSDTIQSEPPVETSKSSSGSWCPAGAVASVRACFPGCTWWLRARAVHVSLGPLGSHRKDGLEATAAAATPVSGNSQTSTAPSSHTQHSISGKAGLHCRSAMIEDPGLRLMSCGAAFCVVPLYIASPLCASSCQEIAIRSGLREPQATLAGPRTRVPGVKISTSRDCRGSTRKHSPPSPAAATSPPGP